MTWNALWARVNREAEEEYRYQPDRYSFAQKHLWIPRFQAWGKPAMYAFTHDIM